MPKALPLHLPTADELRAAHEVYTTREPVDYAYRVGQHMITAGCAGTDFTHAEAIHLLMVAWNAQSRYVWGLRIESIEDLLTETEQWRDQYADRHIATLTDGERDQVADLYQAFRATLGPVGAAKALGLLYPRFFPMWDTAIAEAYIGYRWARDKAPPEHYLTLMDYCIHQCTQNVNEPAYGPSLLKTLDEWNFCVWSKGWLPDPRA